MSSVEIVSIFIDVADVCLLSELVLEKFILGCFIDGRDSCRSP